MRRFVGQLGERDQVDLDARIARQARRFDGGARRRILGEIARVYFVHRREVIHILQIDGCL